MRGHYSASKVQGCLHANPGMMWCEWSAILGCVLVQQDCQDSTCSSEGGYTTDYKKSIRGRLSAASLVEMLEQ
eukprot:4795697-Amphidinium_carterae.3